MSSQSAPERGPLSFTLRFGIEHIAFGYWFYIWGVSLAMTPLIFRQSPATATVLSGIMDVVFFTFTLAFLWQQNRVGRLRAGWFGPIKVVATFLLWAGVTLCWTRCATPEIAFAYWLQSVLQVGLVLMLVCGGDAVRVIRKSLEGAVVGALFLVPILLLNYRGGAGEDRMGDPMFFHPNQVGRAMAITGLFAMYLATQSPRGWRRWFWGSSGLVLLGVLVASFSKTSLVGFFLAVAFFILSSKAVRRVKLALAAAVVVVLLVSTPFMIASFDDYSRGIHGNAIETLSGRTTLWADTWDLITVNPIVGYGFYSFRDYGPQIFEVRVPMAHNEWLQLWFSYGLIGVLIAAAIYVHLALVALRARRRPETNPQASLALALLILALTRGLTEAGTTGLVYELIIVVLMTAWMVLPLRRRVPATISSSGMTSPGFVWRGHENLTRP
jgi:exopolysaccharide production protein ExoQ